MIDFPTLGDLADAWITRHCLIPDGFKRRQAFVQYDWQFWCTANHLQVRDDAEFDPEDPPLNQAFVYRRTDVVAAQKVGKGPWAACLLALMAAGPSEFAGWAEEGDAYRCADHGCPCGWVYPYLPGEPMGMRHPSPLIQALATSQEQVANIWRPLSAMIRFGGSRLGKLLAPREEFIRIRNGGEDEDLEMDRIDAVTSSAQSRLGNPISGYVQDETGTHTERNGMADVDRKQRQGAAGMNGRGFTTTNCWDPTQQSVAQKDYEADDPDVFTFYAPPPKDLDFHDDVDRRKILEFNYSGSPHVKVDSIEAEAVAMIKRGDGAAAERFFGNRIVEVKDAWISSEVWDGSYAGMAAES
ncbi:MULTISPECIES: terminase [unclassified Luteococcus]|uniref:terminase n=1 Tax=unclassified Luteococcus TaxID=2639923 RepID=UPI00313A98FC